MITKDVKYTKTVNRKTLTTSEFYDKYNDLEKTQSKCRECFNYNNNFSCSPLDINIKKYILSFDYVDLVDVKLDYEPEDYEKTYTSEDLNMIINRSFMLEKIKTAKDLRAEESEYVRSESITGPCNECKINCKKEYDTCQYPQKMRYSLSSLGFDAELILKDVFDVELILIKPGKLPRYMNNVAAILYDK